MHSRDFKYLGYGFGIGALLASLFLLVALFLPGLRLIDHFGTGQIIHPIPLSATPPASPRAAWTQTATFTPTSIPLPTSITPPSPTVTLTTTESMIASGEIYFSGPLSRQQQIRLYEASMAFVSQSPEQSALISSLINLKPYSDPSTICGPLSIAILQRADILGPELIPYDFFLLNPDLGRDRSIIEAAFPDELYKNNRHKIRLNKFVWKDDPLLPGDFIYIYSGTQGNFEHMLVVNRVDFEGRAYSVTNYNTANGFIINETMLYDPQNPKTGIFYQWSRQEKQLLGSTGFAGFEVWRLNYNPQ